MFESRRKWIASGFVPGRNAWHMGLLCGLALGLLLAAGRPVLAQNCQPQDGYDYVVDVIIETPPVRLHRDRSRAQLTGMSFHGSDNSTTLGLMTSRLEVATQAHYYSYAAEGGLCVWVTQVDVYLRYNTLDIFVAKEYRTNSCEYKVILEHEKQHIDVAKAALRPFVPKVKSALTSFTIPRSENPLGVQSASKGKQQINQRINELIAPLRGRMSDLVNMKQAKVDSPQSYRAVFKRCKNW